MCSNHVVPDRPYPTTSTSAKSGKTFSDPAATSYGSVSVSLGGSGWTAARIGTAVRVTRYGSGRFVRAFLLTCLRIAGPAWPTALT
jgi:hypothetical protein